ncbi:hypothetical protein PLESTM_001811800 [Pleodorina starrii]|nr:hypothetical protein PLESTM_001811800 [Pleodorina starrii]
MIQLKLAVEQLLARTSTAVQDSSAAVSLPPQEAAVDAAPAALPHSSMAPAQAEQAVTPKKQSRSGAFGAFLKSRLLAAVRLASKAQAAATAAAPQAPPPMKGAATAAATALQAAVASPSTTTVGGKGATAHVSVGGSTAGRIAQPGRQEPLRCTTSTGGSPAGGGGRGARCRAAPGSWPRPQRRVLPGRRHPSAATCGSGTRRRLRWQRHQLDTTKSQLDDAVRKLNDMQAEFDELLLCLWHGVRQEQGTVRGHARPRAWTPEPILAAIEEQWMGGAFP